MSPIEHLKQAATNSEIDNATFTRQFITTATSDTVQSSDELSEIFEIASTHRPEIVDDLYKQYFRT